MGIPMTQIPDILLVPGQYQEIDNSPAGAQGEIKKVLLAGYKMKEGTAPAGKPVRVLSEDKTAALFGAGSDAYLMARAFLRANKIEECWVLPLTPPEDEAASAWSKPFEISGTATANGLIRIAICGTAFDVGVSKDATADAVAAAITSKVNSDAG